MKTLKQNQLNSLEMSKIYGARTKSVVQGSDGKGNCITITTIDNNDGSIRKIKMQPSCNISDELEGDFDSDF
ncbi:hypothetical protein [Chryseobacterium chendengshani]|uniref:hypothetical protein n=1 Tax=Chryseobacterium sp. LJ756 TaxID=2864113 RepID=UPI001C63C870|nr:hypothetical protein [Chryseobacterium sp. LJ756]MBW7675220.1 hypothetical protein [Chryseobacterium sp. LJ756]